MYKDFQVVAWFRIKRNILRLIYSYENILKNISFFPTIVNFAYNYFATKKKFRENLIDEKKNWQKTILDSMNNH